MPASIVLVGVVYVAAAGASGAPGASVDVSRAGVFWAWTAVMAPPIPTHSNAIESATVLRIGIPL